MRASLKLKKFDRRILDAPPRMAMRLGERSYDVLQDEASDVSDIEDSEDENEKELLAPQPFDEDAMFEAAAAALDAAVLEAATAVVLVVLDAAAAEAEAAAVVAATSSAFGARKINPAATSNTHEIEAIDVTCRSIEVRNFPRAGLERRTGVSSVWIQQERRQRAASSAGLSPLEWIYLAPMLLLRGGQRLRLSHQPLVGRAYAIDRLLGASHLIGWRRSKGRSERQTVKDVSIGVKEYGV